MNENSKWVEIIVDECVKAGVRYACIGAGSRSTPLTIAFVRDKSIESISFVDERSAGFFAIGLAMYSQSPVVLICTSGTALANFHPAVLEAFYAGHPLIVLSADRPHELRYSGANQTMDQVKFFGTNIKYSEDFAIPDPQPLPKFIRYLRTNISKALIKASNNPIGPIHLNFPFRKPLVPETVSRVYSEGLLSDLERNGRDSSFLSTISGTKLLNADQLLKLSKILTEKGLIIIGPNSGINYQEILIEFSDTLNYPVLADPASGVRYYNSNVISTYDTFMKDEIIDADLIILLGFPPTSTRLLNYIQTQRCNKIIIDDGLYKDSSLTNHIHIDASVEHTLSSMIKLIKRSKNDFWINQWRDIESKTIKRINSKIKDKFFEGTIYQNIINRLEADELVFVSNSLAIRHLDQFVYSSNIKLQIFSNRGLSGIDGNLSSAFGIAKASAKRIHVLIGDLTFYHDLTALLTTMKNEISFSIYLINNFGGGIFHRLPIAEYKDVFTDYFITPHSIEFAKISEAFSIPHKIIKDIDTMNNTEFCNGIYEFIIDAEKSNSLIKEI